MSEAGAHDICILCWWEDDGQGDEEANVVRGGPNGDLSLLAARMNFRDHLTIYPAGRDTRIGGADTQAEVAAKRAIISGFERLRAGAPDDLLSDVWVEIEAAERVLLEETDRKIQEYEEQQGQTPA